jgi:hypothetical protein
MLETFDNKVNNISNSEAVTTGDETVNVGIPKVIEGDLKYTPKSEFINNAKVLSGDEVIRMDDVEKSELVLKLQRENEAVRKDNEQFRQKNFVMYMKLRKLAPNEV